METSNVLRLIPNSYNMGKEESDRGRLYKKIINLDDMTISCMLVVCHSWLQSKIDMVRDELENILGIEMTQELYNIIKDNNTPYI